MIKKSATIKSISLFLSGFVFVNNSVFAHTAETNLWKERQENQKQSQDIKFAALPQSLQQVQSSLLENISQKFVTEPSHSIFSQRFQSVLTENRKAADLLQSLPQNYGTLRHAYTPQNLNNKKIILHIQDIHANTEAQNNISKTLNSLIKNKKLDLVGLEGAIGEPKFKPFQTSLYKRSVSVAADYMLSKNEISGAAYSAFTAANDAPKFIGIETENLYERNVTAFKTSSSKIKTLRHQFESQELAISQAKAKLFNKSLLDFDRSITEYRNDQLSTGELAQILASKGPTVSTNMEIFLQAYHLEKTLPLQKAEQERTLVIQKLLGQLNTKETQSLVDLSLSYRCGKLTPADFYQHLKTLCEKKGIRLAQTPSFNSYIQYLLLADSVNGEDLYKEIDSLVGTISNVLAKTKTEKNILQASRTLYLKNKLVQFALTTEEWKSYKSDIVSLPELKSFEDFYLVAENRDIAMANNFDASIQKSGAKVSALVTGGFHAQGLTRELTKKGYTILSFVPNVSQINTSQNNSYLSVFTQEKTPLQQIFQGDKLFLASPQGTASQTIETAILTIAHAVGSHQIQGTKENIQTEFQSLVPQAGTLSLSEQEESTLSFVLKTKNTVIQDTVVVSSEKILSNTFSLGQSFRFLSLIGATLLFGTNLLAQNVNTVFLQNETALQESPISSLNSPALFVLVTLITVHIGLFFWNKQFIVKNFNVYFKDISLDKDSEPRYAIYALANMPQTELALLQEIAQKYHNPVEFINAEDQKRIADEEIFEPKIVKKSIEGNNEINSKAKRKLTQLIEMDFDTRTGEFIPANRINSNLLSIALTLLNILIVYMTNENALTWPLLLGTYLAYKLTLFGSTLAHASGHLDEAGFFFTSPQKNRLKKDRERIRITFQAMHISNLVRAFLEGSEISNEYVPNPTKNQRDIKEIAKAGNSENWGILGFGIVGIVAGLILKSQTSSNFLLYPATIILFTQIAILILSEEDREISKSNTIPVRFRMGKDRAIEVSPARKTTLPSYRYPLANHENRDQLADKIWADLIGRLTDGEIALQNDHINLLKQLILEATLTFPEKSILIIHFSNGGNQLKVEINDESSSTRDRILRSIERAGRLGLTASDNNIKATITFPLLKSENEIPSYLAGPELLEELLALKSANEVAYKNRVNNYLNLVRTKSDQMNDDLIFSFLWIPDQELFKECLALLSKRPSTDKDKLSSILIGILKETSFGKENLNQKIIFWILSRLGTEESNSITKAASRYSNLSHFNNKWIHGDERDYVLRVEENIGENYSIIVETPKWFEADNSKTLRAIVGLIKFLGLWEFFEKHAERTPVVTFTFSHPDKEMSPIDWLSNTTIKTTIHNKKVELKSIYQQLISDWSNQVAPDYSKVQINRSDPYLENSFNETIFEIREFNFKNDKETLLELIYNPEAPRQAKWYINGPIRFNSKVILLLIFGIIFLPIWVPVVIVAVILISYLRVTNLIDELFHIAGAKILHVPLEKGYDLNSLLKILVGKRARIQLKAKDTTPLKSILVVASAPAGWFLYLTAVSIFHSLLISGDVEWLKPLIPYKFYILTFLYTGVVVSLFGDLKEKDSDFSIVYKFFIKHEFNAPNGILEMNAPAQRIIIDLIRWILQSLVNLEKSISRLIDIWFPSKIKEDSLDKPTLPGEILVMNAPLANLTELISPENILAHLPKAEDENQPLDETDPNLDLSDGTEDILPTPAEPPPPTNAKAILLMFGQFITGERTHVIRVAHPTFINQTVSGPQTTETTNRAASIPPASLLANGSQRSAVSGPQNASDINSKIALENLRHTQTGTVSSQNRVPLNTKESGLPQTAIEGTITTNTNHLASLKNGLSSFLNSFILVFNSKAAEQGVNTVIQNSPEASDQNNVPVKKIIPIKFGELNTTSLPIKKGSPNKGNDQAPRNVINLNTPAFKENPETTKAFLKILNGMSANIIRRIDLPTFIGFILLIQTLTSSALGLGSNGASFNSNNKISSIVLSLPSSQTALQQQLQNFAIISAQTNSTLGINPTTLRNQGFQNSIPSAIINSPSIGITFNATALFNGNQNPTALSVFATPTMSNVTPRSTWGDRQGITTRALIGYALSQPERSVFDVLTSIQHSNEGTPSRDLVFASRIANAIHKAALAKWLNTRSADEKKKAEKEILAQSQIEFFTPDALVQIENTALLIRENLSSMVGKNSLKSLDSRRAVIQAMTKQGFIDAINSTMGATTPATLTFGQEKPSKSKKSSDKKKNASQDSEDDSKNPAQISQVNPTVLFGLQAGLRNGTDVLKVSTDKVLRSIERGEKLPTELERIISGSMKATKFGGLLSNTQTQSFVSFDKEDKSSESNKIDSQRSASALMRERQATLAGMDFPFAEFLSRFNVSDPNLKTTILIGALSTAVISLMFVSGGFYVAAAVTALFTTAIVLAHLSYSLLREMTNNGSRLIDKIASKSPVKTNDSSFGAARKSDKSLEELAQLIINKSLLLKNGMVQEKNLSTLLGSLQLIGVGEKTQAEKFGELTSADQAELKILLQNKVAQLNFSEKPNSYHLQIVLYSLLSSGKETPLKALIGDKDLSVFMKGGSQVQREKDLDSIQKYVNALSKTGAEKDIETKLFVMIPNFDEDVRYFKGIESQFKGRVIIVPLNNSFLSQTSDGIILHLALFAEGLRKAIQENELLRKSINNLVFAATPELIVDSNHVDDNPLVDQFLDQLHWVLVNQFINGIPLVKEDFDKIQKLSSVLNVQT